MEQYAKNLNVGEVAGKFLGFTGQPACPIWHYMAHTEGYFKLFK